MKRFKFSLQTVHDFREFRRDAAEREFAEALDHLYRAQSQLEEVKRAHRTATDNYLLLYQSREIQATMVASHTDFIASLMRREHEVINQIAGLEKQLETKRHAVTEAMRATKTTAQLSDRQRERHDVDVARMEQTLSDEMAVAAMTRRRINR